MVVVKAGRPRFGDSDGERGISRLTALRPMRAGFRSIPQLLLSKGCSDGVAGPAPLRRFWRALRGLFRCIASHRSN